VTSFAKQASATSPGNRLNASLTFLAISVGLPHFAISFCQLWHVQQYSLVAFVSVMSFLF
jgi:hypothetical protein